MPKTPTAAELEISNDVRYAAYDTLLSARASGADLSQAAAQVLDAVARPVVAAELRRIADRHVTAVFTPDTEWEAAEMHATEKVVAELRARADELDPLDPPARQED